MNYFFNMQRSLKWSLPISNITNKQPKGKNNLSFSNNRFPEHSVFKFFQLRISPYNNKPYSFVQNIKFYKLISAPIQTSRLLSITLGIILGKLWPKMYTKRFSEIPSFNISTIWWPSCCWEVFTKQWAKTSHWKAAGSGLKENKVENWPTNTMIGYLMMLW